MFNSNEVGVDVVRVGDAGSYIDLTLLELSDVRMHVFFASLNRNLLLGGVNTSFLICLPQV